MAMQSGRMRHRIKVYKDSDNLDEYGGRTGEKTLVSNPWCTVTPLADVEHNATGTVGQYLIEFGVRYSKDLENPSSDMYLVFKNIEYDIVSVINNLELNERLLITAKTR